MTKPSPSLLHELTIANFCFALHASHCVARAWLHDRKLLFCFTFLSLASFGFFETRCTGDVNKFEYRNGHCVIALRAMPLAPNINVGNECVMLLSIYASQEKSLHASWTQFSTLKFGGRGADKFMKSELKKETHTH